MVKSMAKHEFTVYSKIEAQFSQGAVTEGLALTATESLGVLQDHYLTHNSAFKNC